MVLRTEASLWKSLSDIATTPGASSRSSLLAFSMCPRAFMIPTYTTIKFISSLHIVILMLTLDVAFERASCVSKAQFAR